MGTASAVVEEGVKAAGKAASQAGKRAAKSRKAIEAAKAEPKADPTKYKSDDDAMRMNDDSYDSPPSSGSKSAAPAKSTSSSSTASSVADTSPKATRNTAAERLATRAGLASGAAGVAGLLLSGDDKAGKEPAKSSGGTSGDYKVKKGDTLSQIAKAQGTTVKELLASNSGIKDMNKIKEGMSLKAGKATPERKSVYDDLKSLKGRGEDAMERKSGGSLRRSGGGGLGAGQALRGWGAVRKK
jgi:LysM repeat protein